MSYNSRIILPKIVTYIATILKIMTRYPKIYAGILEFVWYRLSVGIVRWGIMRTYKFYLRT